MSTEKILIVRDDRSSTGDLERRLASLGYSVVAASGAAEALEMAGAEHPRLALLDLRLEAAEGTLDLALQLRRRFRVPVVYLTGDSGGELLERTRSTAPLGYVLKPIDDRQLHLNLETALLAREREDRRDEAGEKRTEEELNETIDKLRSQTQLLDTVMNSMSDGLVVASSEGKLTLVNGVAEEIVGMGAMDIDPEEWSDAYGSFRPDGTTRYPVEELPLTRALMGESTDDVEIVIRNRFRPEGVRLNVSGRPLAETVDGQGGGVILLHDITKQKKTEQSLLQTMEDLRHQTDLMEAVFNSIREGIAVADRDGRFLYVNPGASRILGLDVSRLDPEEWMARHGSRYADRETRVNTEDLPLVRAIHTGEAVNDQDLYIRNAVRKEGIFVRSSAQPLFDAEGAVSGGVATFRDVTQEIQVQDALMQAFADGRLEIVDTILHNVGNAINSVTVGIETLCQSVFDDPLLSRLTALADAIEAHRSDLADYLENDPQGRQVAPFLVALAADYARRNEGLKGTVERVRSRAAHIADMVRNQKMDGATMDRKDVELRRSIGGAVRLLQDSLQERGIVVDVDCKDAPRTIRVQENRFQQMLVNLMKNAMEAIEELTAVAGADADTKAGPEAPDGALAPPRAPRIEVRSYVESEYLVCDVTDNGIGIEESARKMLFRAGYSTKEHGSGLGLHSAANFVIGSGGKVLALSDGVGAGTTIRLMMRLSSLGIQPSRTGRRPADRPGRQD